MQAATSPAPPAPRPANPRTADTRSRGAREAPPARPHPARPPRTAGSDLCARRRSRVGSFSDTQLIAQSDEPLANAGLDRPQWLVQFRGDFAVAQPIVERALDCFALK